MIVFCILDLLILIWDILIIVHAFVTKNVIWTTWSLMAVALWLLVTIILNLKNDLENRKRVIRRRTEVRKICNSDCVNCKFDYNCAKEGIEYGYNKGKEEIEAELLKCFQGYSEEIEK